MQIQVKVITNAKIVRILAENKKEYKVKLTKPREKNKANLQLITLLSKHFNVSKSKVKIIKGIRSSKKVIEISR